MFSTEALKFVRSIEKSHTTVLDIGSGSCEQTKWLLDHTNMQVTATDLVDPPDWRHKYIGSFDYIKGLFQDVEIPYAKFGYDCVFISHVLEHQLNPHNFLVKALSCLAEGGWLVLTFPPLKHDIVGGHVSVWNAGLLMYHLILAGIDCRYAKVHTYGYNVTLAVQKKSIEVPFSKLKFDNGDIETLRNFFPDRYNYQGFPGEIQTLNWRS